MAVRPLPGASYHTLDTVFHSFGDVELEATGSLNARDPPEKDSCLSNESTPLIDPTPDNRKRSRRGLPPLLSILVLFCLVFTASAFLGYPTHRRLVPDVPDRHASMADHLSSALEAQSYRALVNENYDGALVAMDLKLKCRNGCPDVNVWDHLFRTFPMLNPSLNRTDIAKSAVVLHWQGTDSSLKPMLISNSDAVLAPQNYAQDLSCDDDDTEHKWELADVQSGVGMLIAVNSLLQSGYQPSRTLVLTLMLGEASDSDAPKVSEYLHTTYEELGLGMKFEPQAPECNGGRFRTSRIFRTLIGEEPGAIVTLRPASTVPGHAQAKPFDEDEPRVFRYIFGPTIDQATLMRLRIKATRVWTRLILEADGL